MENKHANPETGEAPDRFHDLYIMLLDAIPSSVLLIDRGLRVISANRNFLEKSRRIFTDTIGAPLKDVLPEVILDQMDICKLVRKVIASAEPIRGERLTFRAPGVPMRTYYYSILPFPSDRKIEGVLLLLDDVTEQIRLGEEVRSVERHMASIVESANDIVLSLDDEGAILTWNRAAENLTGYSAAEARGRSLAEFFIDDDQEEILEIPAIVDDQILTQPREFHIRTKSSALIDTSWVFSPMKDSRNRLVGMVGVGRDLSERRKMESELLQTQKLAALGVMAGGIAHEIRNPLAICSSAAQFLRDEDLSLETRRDCVEKILQGIQRAASIIENLLKYSRSPMTAKGIPVDLVTLIRETWTLVAYHAKTQNIQVEMSFPQASIIAEVVAVLLQQTFMNLFLNAISAMPGGGTIKIEAIMMEVEVHVRVIDTGCGIPQSVVNKIFDPFYTTSSVGKGTGLGLALCYSIMKQHGGAIEVQSNEGQGSIFTVKVPFKYGGGVS